jgi:hypothetical protein
MRAIVVIVANVIGKKSFQVSLWCDRVDHGGSFPPSARPLRFATDSGSRFVRRLSARSGGRHFQTVFLVAIEEQESGKGFVRKRFS